MSKRKGRPISSGPNKRQRTLFYAVKEGRIPGIYDTWEQCEKQVVGYSGAAYKKFFAKEEAEAFIDPTLIKSSVPDKLLPPIGTSFVWTDGACKFNGTPKAKGGIGIYVRSFDGTSFQIAKALKGDRQTNQRAEMAAAIKGLETSYKHCEKSKKIILYTDSAHVVDGMTKWIFGWKKAGWKNRS